MGEHGPHRTVALLGFFLAAAAAGAVGAAASLQAPSFYAALARPSWAPPSWLFGPVWSILYALIAIAAWLLFKADSNKRRLALGLWWVQLAVNAAWTWLFFSLHSGLAAFVDIVALVALVAVLVVTSWRVSPLAAGLLVPYLVWVSFASALTVAVWTMNPAML